jgi:CNT family concentrative nucleoside transporter
MATVASNVLALYVFSLKEVFPTIAGHLVAASLLSAPAALAVSKIILPETGQPVTLGVHVKPFYEKEGSFFEAIINGAYSGVKMIVGIAALLIAVLGLVALVDLLLSAVGSPVNRLFGWEGTWSLKAIMGYVFYPFTLICGIPLADVKIISPILGERTIVTEVVAYKDLAVILQQGLLQNPRSAVIATYALCGFAHLASMAIFVGGISALVRERTGDIAKVAIRALIAATIACLLTACVAGTLLNKGSILLGNHV